MEVADPNMLQLLQKVGRAGQGLLSYQPTTWRPVRWAGWARSAGRRSNSNTGAGEPGEVRGEAGAEWEVDGCVPHTTDWLTATHTVHAPAPLRMSFLLR